MREISGYFFIGEVITICHNFNRHILFGKRVHKYLKENRENVATNNFTPYDSRYKSEKAAKKFLKWGMTAVQATPINLEMKIAECESELEKIKNSDNFAVLIEYGDSMQLAGPYIEINRDALPYITANKIISLMEWNNYLAFSDDSKKLPGISWTTGGTPFEQANYIAREYSRQAQAKALITTFHMEKFPKIKV